MEREKFLSVQTISKDLTAGLIVFLVALPLCLGIAVASGAPPIAGLIAGIVGGIVVGAVSGSHTSVSGPAAGLTAIVAVQITSLGFEAFLLAVVIGGVIQIGLGIARAGSLSAFFPSSVIKGLLAAIGVILILKQIPHLVGHDKDPEGDLAFVQPDHENTFTELFTLFSGDFHYGALVVGVASLAFLILWDRFKILKNSLIPAPLIVVLFGVAAGRLYEWFVGGVWVIQPKHMVQVPISNNLSEFVSFVRLPDFSQILSPAIYVAGITIAIVASLETLLNLEAVDKQDPKQRRSPPSRELLAQGVGNVTSGLLGGLPVTSVIIRGTVNVNAGARTKLSTLVHGVLLLFCVMLLPTYLNMIPLSSLAAILLLTGFKLASPKLFRQMWSEGRYQFLPFIITLLAIVFTDLLIGILVGLGVSIIFILVSNLRRPIRRIVEKHVGGDVLHVELSNQVSFLNRAALERTLREAPDGSHVLLDARRTDYIDPDVLSLIRDFRDVVAPAHDVQVSLRGFRDKYKLDDAIQFVDYTTRELQEQLTPAKVLQVLKEGNERFRNGHTLDRDLTRQLREEVVNQHPMAVLLSGIHSRTPPELIFDLGLGDIFSIRIGGNVVGPKVIGCTEYGCAVAGAKLVVVMGHTGSAMVTAAINHFCNWNEKELLDVCPHLSRITVAIEASIEPSECGKHRDASPEEKAAFIDTVARRNVLHSVHTLLDSSKILRQLVDDGHLAVIGAMYDVATGQIEFLTDDSVGISSDEAREAVHLS